jgi:hypothetical protein
MDKYRSFRWYGRLLGFLGMIFFISFLLGDGFDAYKNAHASFDIFFVLTIMSFSFFAYVVAWFIEIVGGSLLILSGLAMGLYTGFSEVFTSFDNGLLFSLPFIIPGIFFIIAWVIKQKAKKRLINDLT